MSTHSTCIRAVSLMATLVSTSVSAAQFEYSLRAGINHTDNIGLTQEDPISQTALAPGFAFTLQQQGSTLQANVVGNLEYRDYLGGAFDNQTLTQLAGEANWTMLPERLDFSVMDYAGVQPLSSFSSNAPDNQQQTNVLTLGPTLRFRLNATLRGQAELRYTNSRASKTKDFNSSRGKAALRLFKDLSPNAWLSANAETERVTFDNEASGSAYERTQLFASSATHSNQVDVDASLGWSRLSFDDAASVDTPLARLRLAWRMTPSSTLALRIARQYADAAEDLIAQVGQNIGAPGSPAPMPSSINTGNAVINSQIYIERRLEAIYSYDGSRFAWQVAPLYRKFDYVNDSSFNQRGRGGSASLGYRVRPQTTLSAFADTESLRYESRARTDRTTNLGIALIDQRTEHWSWTASLTRYLRHSSVADASYHANVIYLGLTYRR